MKVCKVLAPSILASILSAPQPAIAQRVIDTYRGDQDATIYGYNPIHQTGSGMVIADFNGDGVADLAISLVGQGPGQTRMNVGEIQIFFGGARMSGNRMLETSPGDVVIYGANTSDIIGQFLESGDLNGDGIADLIVAAANTDGPGGTRPDAGELFVFFGRRVWPATIDLLSESPDVLVYGRSTGDFLNRGFAADVSGDGIPDLGVSSAFASGPTPSRDSAGEVDVFFGPIAPGVIDLAGSSPDVVWYGARQGDRLSLLFGRQADINGDGIVDLVAVAPDYAGLDGTRAGAGGLFALLGPVPRGTYDLASAAMDLRVFGTTTNGQSVTAWVTLGDLNADGVADVVMSGVGREAAYALYGGPSLRADFDLATVTPDFVLHGDSGTTIGGRIRIGDATGDGRADLLIADVSARRYETPPAAQTGALYVISADCSLPSGIDLSYQPAAIRVQGADPDDLLGGNFVTGDLDGDGVSDLVVSAPRADGLNNSVPGATGEVYVIYGVANPIRVFDLHRGSDRASPPVYVADAIAPFADAPGTLVDGNLYYYNLGPLDVGSRLGAYKLRGTQSVRLSWPDPGHCNGAIVSPASTYLAVAPQCVLAGGVAKATITVVPKDALGEVLGNGLTVAVDGAALDPGRLSGPMQDAMTGTYTQDIVSPFTGTGEIAVTIEGTLLAPGLYVTFVLSLPAADFSYPTPAHAGVPVVFTDATTGGTAPYTYSWDFESDGTPDSAIPSPNHIYATPGMYRATLQVSDVSGCPSSASQLIDVQP